MNRTTVTFLALAILLAHTLAIHQTLDGNFAPPYDMAHVAFRLGHNLVHSGAAVWNPIGQASESYPSFLWVLLAALADALEIYPTTLAQTTGILSALITIIVMAQFSTKRMAGLTAPVLLACSGSAAAAASSGTEAATAMFLVSMAFLAYEMGWRRLLAVALSVLLVTRSEGVILLWCFMLLEFLDRRGDDGVERPALWRAFILPVGVVIISAGVRQWAFGDWLSPLARAALSFDAERLRLGLDYAASFFLSSGSAPLVLLPLVLMLCGILRGRGRRGLVLFLAWSSYVLLTGGDGLPFWNALAPTLPLAFLAVQRAMILWLDRFPRQAPAAFCCVSAALLASLLVSKLPGDVGPIRLEPLLNAWMRPGANSVESFPHSLGREGQLQEIRDAQRMRTTALFLVTEGQVLGDARIATFWPGAIGYLSRRSVIDVLGRATSLEGQTSQSWRGQPRVDLVSALGAPADYLILDTDEDSSLSIAERFHSWLSRYDRIGDTQERFRQLVGVLRQFELVSVPVPMRSANPDLLSSRPFLLLRNRNLKLTPKIEITRSQRKFQVLINHHGHRQVADLVIKLVDQDQNEWTLAPNGTWHADQELRARSNVLIYDTGDRPFEILSNSLPADFKSGNLHAHLLSPGTHLGSVLENNFKSIAIEL